MSSFHRIESCFVSKPYVLEEARWGMPSNEAVFVIGDVHGHYFPLVNLLKVIGGIKTPGHVKRKLIFLGDLIDRGPDSVGVLQTVLSGKARELARADEVVCLKGNHELMFLETLEESWSVGKEEISNPNSRSWLGNGGFGFCREVSQKLDIDMTLDCFFFEKFQQLIDVNLYEKMRFHWMSHMIWEDFIFVHAGVNPKDVVGGLILKDEEHFEKRDIHWAWIRDGFLNWDKSFVLGGDSKREFCIVHGHTPAKGCHMTVERNEDLYNLAFQKNRVVLDFGAQSHIAIGGAVFHDNAIQILNMPCIF